MQRAPRETQAHLLDEMMAEHDEKVARASVIGVLALASLVLKNEWGRLAKKDTRVDRFIRLTHEYASENHNQKLSKEDVDFLNELTKSIPKKFWE